MNEINVKSVWSDITQLPIYMAYIIDIHEHKGNNS